MRILGGTDRGRRLIGPASKNQRPTSGRVKEALFNILAKRIHGTRFLDLYAGTGLIGIEALSRGALHATFVEKDPAACRVLTTNLRHCGYQAQADIHTMDAIQFVSRSSSPPYEIVFLDPPYHIGEEERILPSLERTGIISPDSVVVIEHFHKTKLPQQSGHLTLVKSYRYGDTCLAMYQPVITHDTP